MIYIFLRKTFLLFFGILFFFGFSQAFAFGKQLDYRLLPSYPSAYQSVEMTLSSNYFDLDGAEVSIFVDGILVKKDYGIQKFHFTTKGVGQKTAIKIEAKKYTGGTESREFTIIPAEVQLVYEMVKPYRPFGYLGKSVALSDSRIDVRAFTDFVQDGKKVDSKKLIFE